MNKLASLDELFGELKQSSGTQMNSKSEVNIDLLVPFSKHPFRLYTGTRLDDMVRSIKEFGILQPLIVRPYPLEVGKYEILAGHNRCNGAKIAEIKKVPIIIMEGLTDDEAMLVVIESNLLQRSFTDLTYSERALILSEHYKALKSQGRRTDIINQVKTILEASEINDLETSGHDVQKLDSRDKIGQDYNLDGRTIARYLRINLLTDEVKRFIDDRLINFSVGVELSYISEENQIYLIDILNNNNFKVTPNNAKQLRKLEKEGKLNEISIEGVLAGIYDKPIKKSSIFKGVKLKSKVIKKYFSEKQTEKEVEEIIDKALESYFQIDKSNNG
jgi:ParB family chromosome partitioning protein